MAGAGVKRDLGGRIDAVLEALPVHIRMQAFCIPKPGTGLIQRED